LVIYKMLWLDVGQDYSGSTSVINPLYKLSYVYGPYKAFRFEMVVFLLVGYACLRHWKEKEIGPVACL